MTRHDSSRTTRIRNFRLSPDRVRKPGDLPDETGRTKLSLIHWRA